MKKYILYFFLFLITNFAFGQVTLPYTEDFENTTNFNVINGTQANKWFVGSAVNNGGSKSLYISNDASGNNNDYANTSSVTHAYLDFSVPNGVTKVGLSFDWRANGEVIYWWFPSNVDYLQVWLVPVSFIPVAGTAISTGGGRTLVASLNRSNSFSKNTYDLSVTANSNMRLVFSWINDGSINNQNAAAIDNLSIVSNSCSGTPTGGTASLSATTGNPNSTFTASVTGSSAGSGFTYQWQSAPSSSGPWTNISGATSSGSTTITAPSSETTTYYRRVITCTSSGGVAYSTVVSYTTAVSYCTPNSSSPSTLYINSFQFVGVLNNPPANIQTGITAYSNGYQNYTSFAPIAQQPQNTALNIVAKTNGTSGGSWKAWVDWNRDGDFNDVSEEVYKMTTFRTTSVTFGFIIPNTVNGIPILGSYRIRISTSNTSNSDGSYDFDPCTNLTGEYEDYLFEVVTDCPAKVTSVNKVNPFDGERCGAGSVRLSAIGNASAVTFNWYDSIYGGTLLGTGNIYNTPSIATTTTYYVTAVSSTGCETAFRYPVEARIDPNPTVTFSTSKPSICGEDDPDLLVTAAGDRFQDVIFEKFDSGLGLFKGNVTDGESIYKSSIAEWLNKSTPYIPKVAEGYEGLSPAMSSGYFGGNYAMINSDIDRSTNIKYHLVSNNTTNPNNLLDVRDYLNLQLDFDLYHFSIAKNNDQGYFEVSYTLDASVANPVWIPLILPSLPVPDSTPPVYLTRYWDNIGNPLKWQHFSVPIPGSNFTTDKFAIRFTHFSSGNLGLGQKFYEGITAVDNVRLYGYKNIKTLFSWSSGTTTLYKPDCVTALGSALESTVCVKPTATELEDVNWALNASATFSNGCPAIGNYTVSNDTKTWLQPSIIDWNLGAQWKPASVPTIAKCVIVRTPVVLPTGSTGTHGLARSVIVKSGGKLTVEPKSSLTIQNYIKNEAAATDVIVESDANLIQKNNAAVNIGDITVRRNAFLKYKDYNYWGAPVTGQNVRNFSPNTLSSKFLVYNEANDFFDGLFVHNKYPYADVNGNTISTTPTVDMATNNFINGYGYCIRASEFSSNTDKTIQVGEFKGIPNNGIIDVSIFKSSTGHGYNLISNPYPSNIDFEALYNYGTNSNLIYNTAFFWTNTNFNPQMQGSKYPSNLPSGRQIVNNYAVLNGTGGVAAPYANGTGNNDPIGSASNCLECITPNKYVKVGQGFIVKAKASGKLVFENGSNIRNNNASSVFFNRMSVASKSDAKDRFWLNLKTPLDFNTPLLVGYIKGATDNYEEDYDAELMVYAGDSFYSALDDKKLAIQGRSYPFNEKDVIVLGASFGLEGQYEISLSSKEGVFESGQNVYLKDNLTGMVANLSEGKYAFHANAGDSVDRFEVQYKPANTLDVSNTEKENLKVYQTKNEIVIDSPTKVTGVKIYDASGKLLYTKKENENKVKINSVFFKSGVYLVEVETSQGKQTKKILK